MPTNNNNDVSNNIRNISRKSEKILFFFYMHIKFIPLCVSVWCVCLLSSNKWNVIPTHFAVTFRAIRRRRHDIFILRVHVARQISNVEWYSNYILPGNGRIIMTLIRSLTNNTPKIQINGLVHTTIFRHKNQQRNICQYGLQDEQHIILINLISLDQPKNKVFD